MASRTSTKTKKPAKRPAKKLAPRRASGKLGTKMTLVEIVRKLDTIDDGTICMRRPWSATAECIIRPFDPDDTAAKMAATGFEYFLEIDVIKEDVLGVFSQWPKKPPTEDEKVRVILYYAENDAWPEWVYKR